MLAHFRECFMIAARILQNAEPEPMEYKGVEYSVVQLTEGAAWRWEVRFADGKSKSGVTEISRAAAIKLAEYEIDRALRDRK
jgi:hypothetical protein